MPSLLQRFRNTFLPSAQVAAERRRAAFGTTSKIPAVILAATVLPVGRIAKAAGGLFQVRKVASAAPALTSVARSAATKSSTFLQSARGIYDRALGNPLAGGGLGGFGSRIFGRTLGGASVAVGAALTEAAVTGGPFQITPRRIAYGALGFGVGGPIGALAGSLFGGSRVAAETIKNLEVKVPQLPTPYDFGGDVADALRAIGRGAESFGSGFTGSFGIPSASYGSTISPSINVGGGGVDPTMLALLAALGIGGFALGRKKRRKKKKKKSKKGTRSKN